MANDFFSRKIEGEITVSAFESMIYRSYLKKAALAFETQYPGAKVNVDTFSSMPEMKTMDFEGHSITVVTAADDSLGESDYLSRVSTSIMSGMGADIYALDVLPLHKFVDRKILENLEPYLEGDLEFNKADYRKNILDALHYRGGTWFLPMTYSFSYYAYDATLVPARIAAGFGIDKAWSAEGLFKIGIPLYDGSYKLFNLIDFAPGRGGMFYQLLSENIASFVNLDTGRPNFNNGGFANLLNLVSRYAKQGYIPGGIAGQEDVDQIIQRMLSESATDRYFFKLNNDISLISQFRRTLGGGPRVSTGGSNSAIESDDEIAGIAANADGSVPFLYNKAFGINSQSKNKETAWAFLKFLLSKEIQLTDNFYYLPLHNGAREEMAEIAFLGGYRPDPSMLNDQERQTLETYKENIEAYRAAMERLSDMINCFVVRDSSINEMINQEAQYFFDGSRSADEVARVLQSKADLYLSE